MLKFVRNRYPLTIKKILFFGKIPKLNIIQSLSYVLKMGWE